MHLQGYLVHTHYLHLEGETMYFIFDPIVSAIDRLTNAVNSKGDKIMAAIDNLKTAIANLGSQVSSDLGDLNTSLQT